jgi:hypothetical protein
MGGDRGWRRMGGDRGWRRRWTRVGPDLQPSHATPSAIASVSRAMDEERAGSSNPRCHASGEEGVGDTDEVEEASGGARSGCAVGLASSAHHRVAPPPRWSLRLGAGRSAPVHGDAGPLQLDAGGLHLSTGCGTEEEDGCNGGGSAVRDMRNRALSWGWAKGIGRRDKIVGMHNLAGRVQCLKRHSLWDNSPAPKRLSL